MLLAFLSLVAALLSRAVVVSCRPAWIQLHVSHAFVARHVVVLLLNVTIQLVPLEGEGRGSNSVCIERYLPAEDLIDRCTFA